MNHEQNREHVHQSSLNHKQDAFTRDDLLAFARHCNISKPKASRIIDTTKEAFLTFSKLAQEYEVPTALSTRIQETLRMDV
jgi:serine/threonine-protein kinase HipA